MNAKSLVSVIIVSALVAVAAPPAAVGAPALTKRTTLGMHIAGWDRAVGEAHGYRLFNSGGRQYIVRQNRHGVAPVSPDTNPYVTGNCGSSWMYYNAQGGRKALVDTGYYVIRPVVHSNWRVAVTDKAGVGTNGSGWTANPNSDYWEHYWNTAHSVRGYSHANVTYGAAVLDNGAVCASGDPWDSTNLY